jgi:galacturonosyltransferase
MKKILILTNSLDGFYRFRNEIIIKLLEKKNVIVFCAPTDIRENYYRKLGIHVIDIEINRRNVNLLKEINIFLTYRRIIKTFKPDIILTYTIKPNIYGGLAARFSNIPYYPNITGLGTSMEGKGLFKVLIIILYKIALKRAKTIFVQNEDNLSFIIKKGIKGFSYQLLPGSGVNTNYFTYLEYPTEEKFHFLFIGRIMKSKGIDYYLESSKYISQKYSNVVFHVIGDFEEDYKVKII